MKTLIFTVILLAGFFFGYHQIHGIGSETTGSAGDLEESETAVFAGGCFWCTEADFEKLHGVAEAVSGYTGGAVANPTYEEVSSGTTGHVESVKVVYDPQKITYDQLLDYFWRHVNPTDPDGQFVDRGEQYRSVIFYANERQRQLAEASKKQLEKTGPFDEPIATEILPLGSFYPAEDYHQNYYKNNPIRYNFYRFNSGRDRFLENAWKGEDKEMLPGEAPAGTKMENGETGTSAQEMSYSVPDKEELRQKLTPMQYKVTQEDGTEPAFNNAYWDNHEPGIYVDVVSGEPLFSSRDKFESGTGWPSFVRPLEPGNIVEKEDRGWFTTRTEVRSRHADSHLGHVFTDGPEPTGLRYCLNSAALRFIPKADLEKEGYGKYRHLFE